MLPGGIRPIIAIRLHKLETSLDAEKIGKKRMSIVEKFMTMEYGPAPEDPREALAWLDRHGRRFGHFIKGTWQAPAAGDYIGNTEPFPGAKTRSRAHGSRGGA